MIEQRVANLSYIYQDHFRRALNDPGSIGDDDLSKLNHTLAAGGIPHDERLSGMGRAILAVREQPVAEEIPSLPVMTASVITSEAIKGGTNV